VLHSCPNGTPRKFIGNNIENGRRNESF
jgi:hypothetical protein